MKQLDVASACSGGYQIVLSAPLTETVDNPGFFIQLALSSMPQWMEWALDQKYPDWRAVPEWPDGTAKIAPSGLRVLEEVLSREHGAGAVVVCYPDSIERFIGPATRVVGISTHNPLGTSFATGVYASIFGSTKDPLNSLYARALFERVRANPHRSTFKVIVGGSGAWQISEMDASASLGVDCVVHGRAESPETIELFRRALSGSAIPSEVRATHPVDPADIVLPAKRTTFGVIEITTGCGRRCAFCLPDLNPQMSIPKQAIMRAVAANVGQGNDQIALATEDMFRWGAGHPFYVPNREALLDLYGSVAAYPGVRYIAAGHCTLAPVVLDPDLISGLSAILLDKSPVRLPHASTHSDGRIVSPLIGLETGSARLAKKMMAGKALPFDVADWPALVIEGLTILNRNNWIPVMTLIVGSPDETAEDLMATLDLLHELERRRLNAFLIPSIFTPLKFTRMESARGVVETRELSRLQWQLIMKSWRMTARLGLRSLWGSTAWSLGSLLFWALRGSRANGPNFTSPLLLFSGFPESLLTRWGGLYEGRRIRSHRKFAMSRRALRAAEAARESVVF